MQQLQVACEGYDNQLNAAVGGLACHGFRPKSFSKSPFMGCSFICFSASRLLMTCLFLVPISLLMSPKSVILSAVSVRRTVQSMAAVVDFIEQADS